MVVAKPPLLAMGGLAKPPQNGGGWPSHPHGLRGWFGHPYVFFLKNIYIFKFKFKIFKKLIF
jgi:hypothetical protein